MLEEYHQIFQLSVTLRQGSLTVDHGEIDRLHSVPGSAQVVYMSVHCTTWRCLPPMFCFDVLESQHLLLLLIMTIVYVQLMYIILQTNHFPTLLWIIVAAEIKVGPVNQTVSSGQWANFSCVTSCSQDTITIMIVWFLNNSIITSTLRDTTSVSENITAKQYHMRSKCEPHSDTGSGAQTHSILTLQARGEFEKGPQAVYCAAVELCDKDKSVSSNCTPKMCFSDKAYFDGIV